MEESREERPIEVERSPYDPRNPPGHLNHLKKPRDPIKEAMQGGSGKKSLIKRAPTKQASNLVVNGDVKGAYFYKSFKYKPFKIEYYKKELNTQSQ